ncbi:MAG TPA: hypothetical protein PKH91_11955 [Flavobacterium sp.]|nr:hypothetical protein [Flavobacterium sp.]
MNKLMRKLSISILAVVFAVVAMGATTFAWFTLTNTAKVEQFQVSVTTEEGIELSIDGGNTWSSTITASQFAAAVTIPNLTAVASIDGATAFKRITDLALNGTGTFVDASANNDYLEFNIMIRTTKANQDIYLSNANTKITADNITNWIIDTTFAPVTEGTNLTPDGSTTYTVNPADAARISFTNAASTTVVFENPAAGTNTLGQSFDWGFGALNYYLNKKGYSLIAATDPTDDAAHFGEGYETEELETAYQTAITATASSLTLGWAEATVTVRVWLDGWDAQCYNAIFGGVLKVKIGFTTVKPSA